jgi:hypothetical protein
MLRKVRSRLFPVVAALVLLAAATGSVQAAKPTKSFNVTFCYSADFNGVAPAIVATITWSGYTADGYSMGSGSPDGGFGFLAPLAHAQRSGSVTDGIGAFDDNTFAGASITFHGTAVQEVNIDRPGSSWSGLPAC